jgi:uncharacterized protein YbjT (DUF2867 family)
VKIVTGAFGYIGRHIAARLLEKGERVRTVTAHPARPSPHGDSIQAFPFDFGQPAKLMDHLAGADTLYNTYWIRFEHGGLTFDQAVANTAVLVDCARKAGVRKIVHISVTRPSLDDPLPYYRGKAQQERVVRECGLAYTIVRPTLVFGPGDILVNNIAWLLRRFPLFPVFGVGDYRLQPVFVGDLASLAIEAAANADDRIIDAVGPDQYTFTEFVREMAACISPGTRMLHVPPWLGLAAGYVIGRTVGDVLLTTDELAGLMQGKLTSERRPSGPTRFSAWLADHADELGRRYHSELARHFA